MFFLPRKSFLSSVFKFSWEDPGGGGRALPYLSHMSMCRPKGYGFCDVFGLKTGIDFAHFSLESGLNFEKTTGVYERIHPFNSR